MVFNHNIKKVINCIWPVLVLTNMTGQTVLGSSSQMGKNWYATALTIKESVKPKNNKPITIAIIDDGFRLSHELLNKYIKVNTKEINNNAIDDDGNGFIDDVKGWDVSDLDNDVNPPTGRESDYNHGTYIAGVIIKTLEKTFGANTEKYFRLLPIKAMSNNVKEVYIKDGYKGIQYAINNGADIICCAWSGGTLSREDKAALQRAKDKGVLIVGATGNSFSEKALPPASHESVIAIAAVSDTYKKTIDSNYGSFVDLCAPGRYVIGANVKSDKGLIDGAATSAATAVATAGFSALKVLFPSASKEELVMAVKNTATLLPQDDSRYIGKLGAGFFNLNAAYLYLKNSEYPMSNFNKNLSEGTIDFNNRKKHDAYTYVINPEGAFSGFSFKKVDVSGKAGLSTLQLFNKDNELVHEFKFSEIPEDFFVAGNIASVKVNLNYASKKLNFKIDYEAEVVDSARLYCKDVQFFELDEGVITDGSMQNSYTNYNNCKWVIRAPAGKYIQIDFTSISTQANQDYVYLFDGETAIPRNLIAKFSGSSTPPKVTSRSNKVLIWFVTDDSIAGQGWKLKYKIVD